MANLKQHRLVRSQEERGGGGVCAEPNPPPPPHRRQNQNRFQKLLVDGCVEEGGCGPAGGLPLSYPFPCCLSGDKGGGRTVTFGDHQIRQQGSQLFRCAVLLLFQLCVLSVHQTFLAAHTKFGVRGRDRPRGGWEVCDVGFRMTKAGDVHAQSFPTVLFSPF